MRVLFLFAHPLETSYGAALHKAVVEELKAAGHDVDDCDLYAENFTAAMSREERMDYLDVGPNRTHVEPHVQRLLAAEGLVLVHPVWNFGYPAILKGYLDRVFLPGVSFKLANGRAWPNLQHIRKLAAVCTYGSDRWRAFVLGDPPRKHFKRSLRGIVHPLAKSRYLPLYNMNRNTEATCAAFIERVSAEMRAF